MKFLIVLFGLLHLAFSNTGAQERVFDVCYSGYGCFTADVPFWHLIHRPISLLPENPAKIATKFYLYTRSNQNDGVQITAENLSDHFKANRPTRFIVHGFLQNGFAKWIIDMKDALLRVEDSNVIAVDWSKGNGWPYDQATTNTQVVGVEIALLVKSCFSKGLITSDDVHIIGHSLGSHIAGYAGERISPKIGRITGLDPAGPNFEYLDIKVRLDPSDAKFVDVIHTDGLATIQLGLGLLSSLGHVDFFPNGGKDQPNCPKTSGKLLGAIFNLFTLDMTAIEDAVACSHTSAVHFYTNSIESGECRFNAYPCNSINDFRDGKCIGCSVKGCNRMGHWASPNNDLGNLYFTTQDATRTPFCYSHYRIKATSNNFAGQGVTKGRFSIVLKGSKRTSTTFLMDNDETLLSGGSVLQSLAESTSEIGSISSATLSFTKQSCFLFCLGLNDRWSFKTIEVIDGQSQTIAKLCPVRDWISTGGTLDYTLC